MQSSINSSLADMKGEWLMFYYYMKFEIQEAL
jgi:hypothetical protein